VPFINVALDQVFDRCNIDTSRIALLGFSDGGSYAITLGISNGDQVGSVVAFSPGTYVIDKPHGTPAYFISHGTGDTNLPIDQTSRVIVPELKARGSSVTYVEFDGGHEVPFGIADQAMTWLGGRFPAR
jgi:phospholipase/carboxylesterase